MYNFLEQNCHFFNLCQIFQSESTVICGEITYTTNMYKIYSFIINFKLFSANYFWLILKFMEHGH